MKTPCPTRGQLALTTMTVPNKKGQVVPTFHPDLQIRPIQVHAQDFAKGDICAVGEDDAAGAWDSDVEGGPQIEVKLQQRQCSCDGTMRHGAGLPDALCRQ